MLLSIIYRIKIGETSAREELNKTDKSKSGDAISGKGVGAWSVFFSFAFHIYVGDESG